MIDIVIYCCIFGNYDSFKELEPPRKSKKFNYKFYLITDSRSIKTKYYKIIHKEILFDSPVKTARFYKINPHKVFNGYKYIYYHDGKVILENDQLEKLTEKSLDSKFIALNHPIRNCTYDEAHVVYKMGFEYSKVINRQLKKVTIPKNFGLYDTCFIFRNIEDKGVVNCIEIWWDYVNNYSIRDQLSVMVSIYETNLDHDYFNCNVYNSKFLKIKGHSSKRKYKYDSVKQFITVKYHYFKRGAFGMFLTKVREKILLEIRNFFNLLK